MANDNVKDNLEWLTKLINVPEKSFLDYVPDIIVTTLRKWFKIGPTPFENWCARQLLLTLTLFQEARLMLVEESLSDLVLTSPPPTKDDDKYGVN